MHVDTPAKSPIPVRAVCAYRHRRRAVQSPTEVRLRAIAGYLFRWWDAELASYHPGNPVLLEIDKYLSIAGIALRGRGDRLFRNS